MDLKFVTIETFIIQLILLVIILWVLNKFLFKPYLSYLDKWEERQEKLEKDYKNIDKLVKDAEKEKEEILKDARNKSNTIISEAENLAKSKKESILLNAENESKSIIESAKKEIEKEKLSMLSQVKTSLTDLILKFNRKLFDKQELNRDFIEQQISHIK